jgi:hypothetical protein
MIDTDSFIEMFEGPLIEHDNGDIHAVIPRVDPCWVVSRCPLPNCDECSLDWDVPCSAFFETPEPSDVA